MIKKIEKEKDLTQLFIKLFEIEKIIEKMEPIDCDNTYQKNIHSLFQKIYKIRNKTDRENLYLNIFLQLLYVFPNYHLFLNEHFNRKFEIVNIINLIDNNEEKLQCYKIHTKNFTNFDWLQTSNLFELYNLCFIQFSGKMESCLNKFNIILVSLYDRINLTKSENENQKEEQLVKLIDMIQSFGDIFIFFIIKEINGYLGYLLFTTSIIEIIPTLFSLIFTISNKHSSIDKDILFKIIVIYCMVYNNTKNEEHKIVTNHIIDMFTNNNKVIFSILFDIYYTMNLSDKNYNPLSKKMSKQIYLSYINKLQKTLPVSKAKTLIDNSALKEYDNYMNKISSIQIYNGCLNLLSFLFQKCNYLIDDRHYCPYIVLQELYLTVLKEIDKGISIIYCYQEMFNVILQLKSIKSNTFILGEWILILQIMYLMIEKHKSQNLNFNMEKLSSSFCSVLKLLSQQLYKVLYNIKLVNLLRDIINVLTLSKLIYSTYK